MQIVATESIIILLLNAMVCPVTIVVPHSYCAKWSNLTSTHNLPPSEANKGRRKIRGITCPPGRVPSAPPAKDCVLCTPAFPFKNRDPTVHAPHSQCCHSHRVSSGSRSEKSHPVPSWYIPRARSGVE